MRLLMALLLVVTAATAAPKPSDPIFAPLWLYQGTWQVSRKEAAAGSKPDQLVNQCSLLGKFFACSQNVNGAQQALVVFLPAGAPGHFYTQHITPDGRATGRTD